MLKKQKWWGWFFVSPFIIGLLFMYLIPVVFSLVVSFYEYDMISMGDWVGLENFKNVFTDPEIYTAYRNTFVFALMYLPLEIFLSCILGVALNQKFKSIALFRVLYYLPVIAPMVAVSMIWMGLYNPYGGVFNWLFSHIGLGPFEYVFSSNWLVVIACVAALTIWKGIGHQALLILSALQGISDDIYEAADIDGAGPVTKFFKITMPLLSPTLFYIIMMGVIGVVNVFEIFQIMASETSAEVKTIATLVYNQAFAKTDVSQAAAIGWVTFIIVGVLTWLQKVGEKRWVHYD